MKRIHLLNLILVSSVFAPWIPSIQNGPMLRLEWFFLIAGIAIFPVSRGVFTSKVARWSALTIVAYAVSLAYGFIVMGVSVHISDLTEMMKPLLYLLFYIFVASGRYTKEEYRGFLRVAIFSLSIAAVITIAQFFAPEKVLPLVRLWADDERIYSYELVRATGTMGNANDLGFLMTIGFALVLFSLKYHIVPMRLGQALLLVSLAAVFATGSRTGMVTIASVSLMYVYLGMRVSKATVVIAGTLTFAVIWLFQAVLSNLAITEGLVERVNSFAHLEWDVPWQTRLELASEMLPLIADSLVFGHGPSKLDFELGANIDNEYILILYRSGIVGLLATVWLVLTLALQPDRAIIYSKSSLIIGMRNCGVAALVAAGIFAYTAGIFLSFRLFGLLTILWTVTANARLSDTSENTDALGIPGYVAGPRQQ